MGDEREYRVATYWYPKLRGLNRALCYLRDFNAAWPGCVIYTVTAKDGPAAKRIAARMRAVEEGAACWLDANRRVFRWNEGEAERE